MIRRFPAVSRWLALALLALVVAAPLAALGLAAGALTQASGTREGLAQQASSFAAIAERQPGLEARRAALAIAIGQGERFLAAEAPAVAGADLQRRVAALVEVAGGQIDTMLVLPGRQEGLYSRIGLRIALLAGIGPLRTILHDLEAGPPSLFIGRLQIQAQDPGAEDPMLSVSFEVYGYMAGGPS